MLRAVVTFKFLMLRLTKHSNGRTGFFSFLHGKSQAYFQVQPDRLGWKHWEYLHLLLTWQAVLRASCGSKTRGALMGFAEFL